MLNNNYFFIQVLKIRLYNTFQTSVSAVYVRQSNAQLVLIGRTYSIGPYLENQTLIALKNSLQQLLISYSEDLKLIGDLLQG